MSTADGRMPLVDVFKALASQLIVLHHLAFYGPMSDVVYTVAPSLIAWLYDFARMAVQVFLVVAGFLAARSLAPQGEAVFGHPLGAIWRRYQRLFWPYLFALCVCVLCAAVVREYFAANPEVVPASPTLLQFLAHPIHMQGLLGYEALSAGVWYLAIDLQLFVLMVFVLWLARLMRYVLPATWGLWLAVGAMGILGAASLFYFNRDASWDNWALYFAGAYVLGALAYWLPLARRSGLYLLALALVVAVALVVDFRLRIVVALCAALCLGLSGLRIGFGAGLAIPVVRFLSKISYSVFLIHFPVCFSIGAIVHAWAPNGVWANSLGMVLAWAASVAAGAVLYRLVESRAYRVKPAPAVLT